MADLDGLVALERIVGLTWNWEGYQLAWRVFCLELRNPQEFVHAAILGDHLQGIVTKGFADNKLLAAWMDSLAEMAEQPKTDNQWAPRWF